MEISRSKKTGIKSIVIDGKKCRLSTVEIEPPQISPGYLTLRTLARRYAEFACSSTNRASLKALRELANLQAEARAGNIRVMHRDELSPVPTNARGMTDDGWLAECRLSLDAARRYLMEHGALNEAEASRILSDPTPATGEPPEKGEPPAPVIKPSDDWIEAVRAIATEYIQRHKKQDLFPPQKDVCTHLEKVSRERKIYSDHGKPLSAGYILRNAIQGKWWQANKP